MLCRILAVSDIHEIYVHKNNILFVRKIGKTLESEYKGFFTYSQTHN